MRQEFIYLQAGAVLEILGILTLITNPDSIVGIETDFQIPALISPDIQGIGLFLIGSAITLYAILNMKR